jgi:hypothetical protein
MITKKEFVSRVKTTHLEYETLLSDLSKEQMLQPHTCGEWSVKDVIAHITWHEREMVGILRHKALIGSEMWNGPLEKRNKAIHAQYKDQQLAGILTEARDVFHDLLKLLEDLNDQDLLDPSHFREMPDDWLPWQVIASNTYDHYPDHVADIRKAFPAL